MDIKITDLDFKGLTKFIDELDKYVFISDNTDLPVNILMDETRPQEFNFKYIPTNGLRYTTSANRLLEIILERLAYDENNIIRDEEVFKYRFEYYLPRIKRNAGYNADYVIFIIRVGDKVYFKNIDVYRLGPTGILSRYTINPMAFIDVMFDSIQTIHEKNLIKITSVNNVRKDIVGDFTARLYSMTSNAISTYYTGKGQLRMNIGPYMPDKIIAISFDTLEEAITEIDKNINYNYEKNMFCSDKDKESFKDLVTKLYNNDITIQYRFTDITDIVEAFGIKTAQQQQQQQQTQEPQVQEPKQESESELPPEMQPVKLDMDIAWDDISTLQDLQDKISQPNPQQTQDQQSQPVKIQQPVQIQEPQVQKHQTPQPISQPAQIQESQAVQITEPMPQLIPQPAQIQESQTVQITEPQLNNQQISQPQAVLHSEPTQLQSQPQQSNGDIYIRIPSTDVYEVSLPSDYQ